MYAYRKAMPRGNKKLDEKWQTHLQQMHRERLKSVKAAVDNKPPQKFPHLQQNLKKQQLDEERYSTIERENYLLLDKMSHIMTHPQTVDLRQAPAAVKSLNRESRKRELMRITEENQQILRRIQHKEPYYNHHQWEEERWRNEQYLRNICEYPVLPSSLKATSNAAALSFMEGEEMEDGENAAQYQQQQQQEMSAAAANNNNNHNEEDKYEDDFAD